MQKTNREPDTNILSLRGNADYEQRPARPSWSSALPHPSQLAGQFFACPGFRGERDQQKKAGDPMRASTAP